MKDARGLDVTVEDREAIAAADEFAARLLRLDQGVEAILDAVKCGFRKRQYLCSMPRRFGSMAKPAAPHVTTPRSIYTLAGRCQ
jgi:hypothetical protein